MIDEQEIIDAFNALSPSDRIPSAFLEIVSRLFPQITPPLKPKAKEWEDVRDYIYNLCEPSRKMENYEAFIEQEGISVSLRCAFEIIIARKSNRHKYASVRSEIAFCRYCWRLGTTTAERRGYKEFYRNDWKKSLAYCGVHKPRAQKIVIKTKEKNTGVRRKVLNQKEIQYGRKISSLAECKERDIIKYDKKMAFIQNGTRAWIAGDYIIQREDNQRWPQFVDLFFPYIAKHPKWNMARSSIDDAFDILEKDNTFDHKHSVHHKIKADRSLLSLYLMPMMLRLDVWLEIQREIANKKRKKKLDRYVRHPWPGKMQ